MKTSLGIEEIKNLYPDEWILIGNPISQENSIVIEGGIPVYHSKDKKEVCYLGREKTKDYDTITLYFTGTFKPMKKIVTVFSHSKI